MWKRIVGGVLLVLGVALYLIGSYIYGEVADGRRQIRSGQKKVNVGKGLFSTNPVTKPFGDALASGAQKKIDAGKEEADRYEVIAGWCHGTGIAFFVIGGVLFGISFIRPKKRRK